MPLTPRYGPHRNDYMGTHYATGDTPVCNTAHVRRLTQNIAQVNCLGCLRAMAASRGPLAAVETVLSASGNPRDGLIAIDRATAVVNARRSGEQCAVAYRLELETANRDIEAMKARDAMRRDHLAAALAALEAETARAPKCYFCGKTAACMARCADIVVFQPACDECCGHSNEDSECFPIAELASRYSALRRSQQERAEPDALHTGDNEQVDTWSAAVSAVESALDEAREMPQEGGAEATIIQALEPAISTLRSLDGLVVRAITQADLATLRAEHREAEAVHQNKAIEWGQEIGLLRAEQERLTRELASANARFCDEHRGIWKSSGCVACGVINLGEAQHQLLAEREGLAARLDAVCESFNKLADECDCRCDHSDDNCCAKRPVQACAACELAALNVAPTGEDGPR